jgi:hypothetical protein
MPRLFNRKVEIRFDDNSLSEIDSAAKAHGISRAEFIRNAALTGHGTGNAPEAPRSASRPLLTPGEYISLVQHVYRALGGAVGRTTAELCVAATVQKLYTD